METTIFNPDELLVEQIDETVTRVKVFLISTNGDILIVHSNGGYQLPGGHVEKDEDLVETVKREVLEETGINLRSNELKDPFYEVVHFSKNYKSTGKNRKSNIIYYLVNTDKKPDYSNLNLTEHEKSINFSLKYININDFETELTETKNNNESETNRTIAKEILVTFNCLTKYLSKNI